MLRWITPKTGISVSRLFFKPLPSLYYRLRQSSWHFWWEVHHRRVYSRIWSADFRTIRCTLNLHRRHLREKLTIRSYWLEPPTPESKKAIRSFIHISSFKGGTEIPQASVLLSWCLLFCFSPFMIFVGYNLAIKTCWSFTRALAARF